MTEDSVGFIREGLHFTGKGIALSRKSLFKEKPKTKKVHIACTEFGAISIRWPLKSIRFERPAVTFIHVVKKS